MLFVLSRQHKPLPIIDRAAPDFTLALLEGGQISMNDLKGKPVVLYFFATWWWRCDKEIPLVKGAGNKYQDKGLQIIGIGIQDKKEKFPPYIQKKGIKWPFGFDEGDIIARSYGITFGAGVIFIDKQGIVRGRFLGGFGEKELRREIEKIL